MTKTTTAKAAPAKTEPKAEALKAEALKAKVPEPVEEVCSECGVTTTNAAHGVCLACRA